MLSRAAALLASRPAIFASAALLLGLCGLAAVHFDRRAQEIARDQQVFSSRQISNGFTAMSDLQRLNIVVLEGLRAGAMEGALRSDFTAAVDFLFIRADHLRKIYPDREQFPPAAVALDQMNGIIEMADTAAEQDFPDLEGFAASLFPASQETRRALHRYLTELVQVQQDVLQNQSTALIGQTRVLWVAVGLLSSIGTAGLLLLRLEVQTRKARDKAEERVHLLAFYDSLTGLPNRVQYQDRLREMLGEHNAVAVAFADIDKFKAINDTYGHAAGDAILCAVAQVLASHVTSLGGFVARLSGDEFAAAIPTDDLDQLRACCEAVIEDVSGPQIIKGETIITGLSIGIATTTQISSQGRVDPGKISRVADFALYASKSGGRGRYTLYDNELEARFNERSAMIEELPRAIDSGDLRVYLQPKATLPDGRIFGFEALVRWQRGGRLVNPGEFISIAEESGSVVEIDLFVLREALRVVGAWNKANGTHYGLSANLSGLHFRSQRIVDEVHACLQDSDFPPSMLTLEITESVQLQDWQQVQGTINALHRLGARISIDDFGTGYSSLAYLRAMTADELKIDRSLVVEIENSMEARFVFDAVVDLAGHLDIDVIVEGIESASQAAVVNALGVSKAQGFYFGKPVPAREALAKADITPPRPILPNSVPVLRVSKAS